MKTLHDTDLENNKTSGNITYEDKMGIDYGGQFS